MGNKIEELKQLAQSGDAEAQYMLGDAYAKGTGVQQDDSKTIYWYTKAAEQGHVLSQELININRNNT